MKKFLSLLTGLFLVFVVAGSASALTYGFSDTWTNPSQNEVHLLTFTHDIIAEVPFVDTIDDAMITFTFDQDGGDSYYYGWKFWNIHDDREFVGGFTDTFAFSLGEVDNNGYEVILDGVLSLLDDRSLVVTLAGAPSDFHLVDSVLSGNATTAPVPEPATLLLFGLGILGLAGVSRKKLQK